MDLKTIADAIAVRFVGATTTGGETFSSTPTASLPNQIGKGPVCLVYPPTGQLEIGVSRMRNDHYDFPVKILIDPLNVPSRTDALYRWYNATRDLLEGQFSLGLTYVARAWLVAERMEIDGEKYSSTDGTFGNFDVVEYIVRVQVREVVATVAA